jgi:hypothetical protein
MEHRNKSIKLPTFNGEPKEAQTWLMRLKGYPGVDGFIESIEETPDVHLPKSEKAVIDATTEAGKKELKAKRSNQIALANLTMAFTTEALMEMIYKARTTDWPNGLPWMVMKQLHTKYFPKVLVSKIELRRALNGVSMRKEDDPALLFEQTSAIVNKFNTVNCQIPKEDRIATILEKATKEYGPVLTVEQRSKGNNLELEDLHDAMCQLWRTLYRDDTEAGEGAEIGLTSTESQLTCFNIISIQKSP